jgi:hypothetical protein
MAKYSMQPVRCIVAARPAPTSGVLHTLYTGYDYTANLAHHPRTLLPLWHKYVYGIAGNETAKKSTSVERGNVKFQFCCRKCFWDVMVRLVNTGFTELTAVDKVHQPYGVNLSATAIINKTQKEKKNLGHPDLSL